MVTSYAGYGVSGTNILFRPESVFADDEPFRVAAMPTPAASLEATPPVFSSPAGVPSPDSSWKIIVGVTVGVGGAFILAAILTVMMVAAR